MLSIYWLPAGSDHHTQGWANLTQEPENPGQQAVRQLGPGSVASLRGREEKGGGQWRKHRKERALGCSGTFLGL